MWGFPPSTSFCTDFSSRLLRSIKNRSIINFRLKSYLDCGEHLEVLGLHFWHSFGLYINHKSLDPLVFSLSEMETRCGWPLESVSRLLSAILVVCKYAPIVGFVNGIRITGPFRCQFCQFCKSRSAFQMYLQIIETFTFHFLALNLHVSLQNAPNFCLLFFASILSDNFRALFGGRLILMAYRLFLSGFSIFIFRFKRLRLAWICPSLGLPTSDSSFAAVSCHGGLLTSRRLTQRFWTIRSRKYSYRFLPLSVSVGYWFETMFSFQFYFYCSPV